MQCGAWYESKDSEQTMRRQDREQTMRRQDREQTMRRQDREQTMRRQDREQTMRRQDREQTMRRKDREQTMRIKQSDYRTDEHEDTQKCDLKMLQIKSLNEMRTTNNISRSPNTRTYIRTYSTNLYLVLFEERAPSELLPFEGLSPLVRAGTHSTVDRLFQLLGETLSVNKGNKGVILGVF
jgi:hypothetical protein